MPVTTLDADSHKVNLASRVEYYRDETNGLGLNQVRQLPADAWQQSEDSELNFGFTEATYWFRVQLHNKEARDRLMLLKGGYSSFDHIEVFEIHDGQVSISSTGSKVLNEDRNSHRYPLVPIELDGGRSMDLYLKVENSGAFYLPLHLLDWQTFVELDDKELLTSGAYFGIWLIVIVCNLLLYVILRHISLLSFTAFIFTLGLYQLSTYGLGSMFIEAMPSFHDHIIVFSVGLAIVSLGWFADSLLELGKTNPIGRRFLQTTGATAGLLMAGYLFLPYSAVIPWLAGLSVANAMAVLVIGLHAAIKGNRLAIYATLAWSTPLMGTVLHALNRFSLVPSNFFTDQAQEAGFIAMILILTVAIAAEMRHRSRQRGLMLLELEQQANAREKERLEEMVRERTAELESTLGELSDAHEALKELTTVDAVTGIKNRQCFDDIFQQERRREGPDQCGRHGAL